MEGLPGIDKCLERVGGTSEVNPLGSHSERSNPFIWWVVVVVVD